MNFDFSWAFDRRAAGVSIAPEAGKVPKGSSVVCKLEFLPVGEASIDGTQLSCAITGGHLWRLAVSGAGARPALAFSFTSFDFGPCFVPARPGAPPVPETAVLRIANNEAEHDVQFECSFARKPHMEVTCPPTVLRPGEGVDVPIVFQPREARPYSEVIPFEVNGLYTVSVNVVGEGAPLLVELVNPAQASLSFGTLRAGQEVARGVGLVNRSRRPVTLALSERLDAGRGRLDEVHVSFAPRELTLRPRESATLDVRYAPVARQAAFLEQLLITVAGDTKPLLSVSGSCQGIEMKLSTDSVSFGSVVEGSRLTRGVFLHNTGDVGTRFAWDTAAIGTECVRAHGQCFCVGVCVCVRVFARWLS